MRIISKLFSMLGWKIILVPSVKVIGFPFGNVFSSADLSVNWPKIMKEVVTLFNVKNIFSVENAQEFVIPHEDEFGGSAH